MPGQCGEKVGYFNEVKSERISPEMGRKATIRWLISEKDGASTFSMRLFEIDAGGKILAHSHPWEHEIFILSGTVKIRIGSKWYVVREGMFLYIPPNVEHEYINAGTEQLRFLCIIPNKPTTTKRIVRC
jgi:quercetin dioxygenase-like cupin family protein